MFMLTQLSIIFSCSLILKCHQQMSKKNIILGLAEPEYPGYLDTFYTNDRLKFHVQLS